MKVHVYFKHRSILARASQVTKNPPANSGEAGEAGSIPRWGRSPAAGNGNPLQYSCLKNPMDRGAWCVTVHGVAKNHGAHTPSYTLFFLSLTSSVQKRQEIGAGL